MLFVIWACFVKTQLCLARMRSLIWADRGGIYRYCGKTDGYCLVSNGCQSGCAGAVQPSATSVPPSASSSQEPVLGSPTSAPPNAPTGTATKDGTCGASNGNTVCGNWLQGSCCSMYGVCF